MRLCERLRDRFRDEFRDQWPSDAEIIDAVRQAKAATIFPHIAVETFDSSYRDSAPRPGASPLRYGGRRPSGG